MEFSRVYCIICGTQIPYRDQVNSSKRDFRAIRCDKDSSIDGKPFLTGIGGYVPRHLPNCAAPSNPETRWNDAGIALSKDDCFPPLIGHRSHPQPGFIFHDVCWKMLQRMLYPHHVPIEKFYDICLSCPASKNGWLDWGHSYGGLMDRRPSDGYPWEDVYVVAFVRRYLGEENSPLIFSKCNPLDVPEIQQALVDSRDRHQHSEESADCCISPDFRGSAGPDCFYKLPLEIREYIQILLPSRSVANVRMASRSFASLPLSQSFWVSRFNPHQERGYCFEATHPLYSTVLERRTRDWKMLYERTAFKRISSSGELKNRNRVWNCSKDLVDLLLEKPLTDPTLSRNLQYYTSSALQEEEAKTWRPVGGDFASRTPPGHPSSGMPCRVIYDQIVPIPFPIKLLGVSFCSFNGERYISGLRFVFDDEQGNEEMILAGYALPSKEKYVDLNNGELTGLIAAISPRGVKALRAVTKTGHITDWAGCPDGLPQTIRLCMKDPIHTLKVSVDGFKLVSLSTPTTIPPLFPPEPRSSPQSEQKLTPAHLPLRTTGLWYPSIPSPSQTLYSSTFPGRNVSLHDYRPLVQVPFGGPRGTLLKHLTRVSVTVSMATIVGIDFFYDDTAPIRSLRACGSTASVDDSVKIPFDVDGPGGEVLTGVQADGDFFLSAAGVDSGSGSGTGFCGGYRFGVVTSLKVTTNRNRSFIFQPSAIPILKLPAGPYVRQKSIKTVIVPGETLTGIYFMHDPKFGMIGIGPISEDLSTDGGPAQYTGIEDEIRARMSESKSVSIP